MVDVSLMSGIVFVMFSTYLWMCVLKIMSECQQYELDLGSLSRTSPPPTHKIILRGGTEWQLRH